MLRMQKVAQLSHLSTSSKMFAVDCTDLSSNKMFSNFAALDIVCHFKNHATFCSHVCDVHHNRIFWFLVHLAWSELYDLLSLRHHHWLLLGVHKLVGKVCRQQ